MADPQKYDRSAAFEMLQKQHGEYASPEQINQELDSYEKANGLGALVEQTAPVVGSAPAPLTGQDKSIADQAANYALVPSTARETVNAITAPPVGSTSLPDIASAAWGNLSTPEKYAVGVGGTALASGAVYLAKKLVDRFLISDKQAAPPIDRTRDISMGDTNPPPPPPPEGPKLSAVDQQIMDRQAINRQVREDYLNRTVGSTPEIAPQTPEQITQAKQTAATQVAQQSMAATPPPESAPLQKVEPPTERPVNPKVPALLQPPMAGAVVPKTVTGVPAEPVATPTAAPVAKISTVAAPSPDIEEKLGKPTLTTGSGMPAYEGQGAEGSKLKHKEGKFASLNDIPKGTVFVPNGQYMDTARNATGQAAYTQNLKSTGGYPTTNEATAAQSRAINASLNRPTREQAIAQGLSLGENTPPITLRVNKKKIVTVAGVTGALVLLPDLASAAQNQDATSAGKLTNTAGTLGLASMMGRAVPPTLPTLGQGIGGRGVNMNPDILSQLLR